MDRAERNNFWPQLWLFFSPFLFPPKKKRGVSLFKIRRGNYLWVINCNSPSKRFVLLTRGGFRGGQPPPCDSRGGVPPLICSPPPVHPPGYWHQVIKLFNTFWLSFRGGFKGGASLKIKILLGVIKPNPRIWIRWQIFDFSRISLNNS